MGERKKKKEEELVCLGVCDLTLFYTLMMISLKLVDNEKEIYNPNMWRHFLVCLPYPHNLVEKALRLSADWGDAW